MADPAALAGRPAGALPPADPAAQPGAVGPRRPLRRLPGPRVRQPRPRRHRHRAPHQHGRQPHAGIAGTHLHQRIPHPADRPRHPRALRAQRGSVIPLAAGRLFRPCLPSSLVASSSLLSPDRAGALWLAGGRGASARGDLCRVSAARCGMGAAFLERGSAGAVSVVPAVTWVRGVPDVPGRVKRWRGANRHDVALCRLLPVQIHIVPVPARTMRGTQSCRCGGGAGDGDRGTAWGVRAADWFLGIAACWRHVDDRRAGWRGRFVWLKGFLLAVQGARSNKLW
jgi:hypothetical protein